MFTYHCTYHFTSHTDREQAITALLNETQRNSTAHNRLVRLVFFGSVNNNDDYSTLLALVHRLVAQRWDNAAPVYSLVIQPLQGGDTLAAEAHYIDQKEIKAIEFREEQHNRYSVIETTDYRLLMLGGVAPTQLSHSIARQSEEVFALVEAIMKRENFPIHRIVRQWNYIERITWMEGPVQHYQAFNDARTLFYQKTSWQAEGYPAATGIGTQWGGVMVDLIAAVPCCETDSLIAPVDNPLQVPAHDYSQQVLLGDGNKRLNKRSTPKFERAKVVGTSRGEGVCFVSGTAAIRGELSVVEDSIDRQVEITLENVAHLISEPNLSRSGFRSADAQQLGNLRVYLKHPHHYREARDAVNRNICCPQQLYVVADVCRDELLVEVEGVAMNNRRLKN